jgi:hypothetical protein
MAIPATRKEFKDYCLRRLGSPVIDINVDDQQVEDRIDEALLYYRDYHYDGTERALIAHEMTATDRTNKYISLNENVIGVTRLLPFQTSTTSSTLFNVRYQVHLNDLFDFSAESIIPYYMAMERVATLEELFTGQRQVRFNRHMDKLYIDMDWENDVQEGEYIIIDCYRVVDPDTHTDVWGDRWLARYASTLIKRQWGSNVSKFEGIQLPGGQTFNAANIVSEAQEELNKLEEEMNSAYSLPVYDMTG